MSERFNTSYLESIAQGMKDKHQGMPGTGKRSPIHPYTRFLRKILTYDLQVSLNRLNKKEKRKFLINLCILYGRFTQKLGFKIKGVPAYVTTNITELDTPQKIRREGEWLQRIYNRIKKNEEVTPSWNNLQQTINDYITAERKAVKKRRKEKPIKQTSPEEELHQYLFGEKSINCGTQTYRIKTLDDLTLLSYPEDNPDPQIIELAKKLRKKLGENAWQTKINELGQTEKAKTIFGRYFSYENVKPSLDDILDKEPELTPYVPTFTEEDDKEPDQPEEITEEEFDIDRIMKELEYNIPEDDW